jgi:hypothetical protein
MSSYWLSFSIILLSWNNLRTKVTIPSRGLPGLFLERIDIWSSRILSYLSMINCLESLMPWLWVMNKVHGWGISVTHLIHNFIIVLILFLVSVNWRSSGRLAVMIVISWSSLLSICVTQFLIFRVSLSSQLRLISRWVGISILYLIQLSHSVKMLLHQRNLSLFWLCIHSSRLQLITSMTSSSMEATLSIKPSYLIKDSIRNRWWDLSWYTRWMLL